MMEPTVAEILQGADQMVEPNPPVNLLQNLPPGQPVGRKNRPKDKATNNADRQSLDADYSDNNTATPLKTGVRSRTRTGSPTPNRDTATSPVDETIANGIKGELHVKLALAGGVIMMALPVTGTAITLRSEMASNAIVEVLKDNPKRLKQLQKLLAASKYSDLALAGASVLTAVALDLRILNPNSTPVQFVIPDVVASVRERMQAAEQAQREQAQTEAQAQNGNAPPQSSNLFDSPAVFTEQDAVAAGFYTPPHSNGGGVSDG